jgi:hypothetical protein
MPGKRAPLSSRMLKTPAALVAAVATQRGLQLGWKLITGEEPPAAQDDNRVPLGQAVAWAVLHGAALTTARMIAGRYTPTLWLSRRQRQGLPEPAPGQADSQDHPPPQPEAPSLPYLMLLAALVWRRRR